MDAAERRQAIACSLDQTREPISASALARRFSVSRQVIVGDIALLRAAGEEILATPRGYVRLRKQEGIACTLACRHDGGQMEAELNAIVDQGCTVADVVVEHPIYGQITGSLDIADRYQVGQFIDRCRNEAAAPLSALTEGIHLHTVLCPDEAAAERVRQALRMLGVLVEE